MNKWNTLELFEVDLNFNIKVNENSIEKRMLYKVAQRIFKRAKNA